jgi:competence protein ComEA
VGPALAARVVAERERRGPFEAPEDLRRVLGFGPKKLALVRDLVSAGAPARAPAPPRAEAPAGDDAAPEPAADAR